MTLIEMTRGMPWYAQVFVFGALVGGWWYLCDCVRDLFKRPPGQTKP